VSLWRQLTRGLRALTHRAAADRETADEVEHYLDQAAAAHRARGLSPDEARRAARIELGSPTTVRQEVRSSGWEHAVETRLADLRYAARKLRGDPGFTAITVLTLALGLGGATAIFSAVRPILFEPLPYPAPGRIAMIWEIGRDGSREQGTFGMYHELAARNHAFEAIAVLRPWQPTMTGAEQPERLDGQRVSASYFAVLGVAPSLGRAFQPSDDRPGGAKAVVISDALWRRRFGADSTVIGRQVTLDDDTHTVVAVMPRGFENLLAPSTELWAPLQYDLAQGRAWGHHLRTVGRLRDGVHLDQATEELRALGRRVLNELRPATYGTDVDFAAVALQEDITRGIRPALLAVLAAVALVLVIACVNVTNLLLARDARRGGEFALRAALGAGQGRLIGQLLTEILLLSLVGGAVGMGVAFLGVRALVLLSPPGLPRVGAIGVDGAAFAFALGLTSLVALVCGLVPALQAARSDPHAAMQQGTRRTVGRRHGARGILVVAEVALALILLVSSGLLLRSLSLLFRVESGFDSSHLLTMQVQTSGRRFAEDSTTFRFFAQALDAARGVPGVTEAALTSQLPLSGDADLYGVQFDPAPVDDPGEVGGTFRYAVSPGYFETMRIPLVRGRLLDERDRAGAPLVAVISESVAKRRLPGQDPVGRRLRVGAGPLYTVVGVVGDVKQVSLALSESDAVYVTADQWRFADNAMSLIVRGRDRPAALAGPIREAIWSVDRDQAVVRVATMDDLVAASAAERRFALTVFEAFALAALLLAAAGIYGVLAGSVAERTREIGVRAALGASRTSILVLVLGRGMTMTAFGIGLGILGAAAASRVMAALLFGISPLDPVTYAGAIALLAGVSLVACGVPAWRAARVDPARTLRSE